MDTVKIRKNKRGISRIFAVLAAVLIAVSFTACGKKKHKQAPVPYEEEPFFGTHRFDVTEREEKIVSNGSTDYKIVVSDTPTDSETLAVSELQLFFKEATGISLPIVDDTALSYSAEAKAFSVGHNDFTAAANVTVPDNVGACGVVVKTAGKSVCITGGQYGVVYAVYEYLRQALGFECYANECYTLRRGVTQLPLCDYDILDIPDIAVNDPSTLGFVDTNWGRRMGFAFFDPFVSTGGGKRSHSAFKFVSPEIYNNAETHPETYHPNWYTADGKQLNYTAGGDPEELKALQDTVTESIMRFVAASKDDKIYIDFTQMDERSWASDTVASGYLETYGTHAASQIIFINPVARAVKERMAAEYPQRELKIVIFAYLETVTAPAKKGDDGKWHPIDDKVKLEDNVAVYFAPIDADYKYSLKHEVNQGTRDQIEAWGSIADTLHVWFYDINFHNYAIPYNTWSAMKETYRLAAENGAEFLLNEGGYDAGTVSGYAVYRAYLNAKLARNTNLDVKTLTDNFFHAYYGPAAEAMLDCLDTVNDWSAYQESRLGYQQARSCLADLQKPEFWPKAILQNMTAGYDKAFAAIAPLNSVNTELYKTYYDRILLEQVSPRFLTMLLYAGTYSSEDLRTERAALFSDMSGLGVLATAEGNVFDDFKTNWNLI